MRHQAEPRPGAGEIGVAVTQYDRVQVNPILVDQAKFSEAVRQDRASHFDLAIVLSLQLAHRARKITVYEPSIGAD